MGQSGLICLRSAFHTTPSNLVSGLCHAQISLHRSVSRRIRGINGRGGSITRKGSKRLGNREISDQYVKWVVFGLCAVLVGMSGGGVMIFVCIVRAYPADRSEWRWQIPSTQKFEERLAIVWKTLRLGIVPLALELSGSGNCFAMRADSSTFLVVAVKPVWMVNW
jgi:hypothetical protein